MIGYDNLHDAERQELYDLMLRLTHSDAEQTRWEAQVLLDHGFELVEVAGLEQTLWRIDDMYFTTAEAIREVSPLFEDTDEEAWDLAEAGFEPVAVYGQEEIVWKRGEEFYSRERALAEIREGEEA